MGGEEKELQPTLPYDSARQTRRGNVSDAVISKLLKDFTCAELFPQSADPSQSKATKGGKKDYAMDVVVSSFKHLHVRRPKQKRRRRAKKKFEQGKSPANLLNLAIAAGNFQKPIVWPSKLNCDCKKSSVSLVNPSRLKVEAGSSGSACSRDNCGSCCKYVSSTVVNNLCWAKCNKRLKAEKQQSRVAPFSNSSAVSGLSFSSLCHDQQSFLKTEKELGLKDKNEACGCTCTNCGDCAHAYFAGQQLFTNTPLMPLSSPALLHAGDTHHSLTAGNTHRSYVHQTPSVTSDANPSSLRLLHQVPSALAQNGGSTSGWARSCSQELRETEETNVNELASYLEDLLHIPRKMSTMAEMMYA